MNKHRMTAWGLAIVAAATLSGCARTLQETEMQDPTTVAQIAREQTQSETFAPYKVKKIALIGFASNNMASSGSSTGGLAAIYEAVRDISALATSIAERGLNQAFPRALKTLETAGFQVLSPETVFQNAAYKSIGAENALGYCQVKDSRVRFGPDNWVMDHWFPFDVSNTKPEHCGPIIDALGVDGVLAAYFQGNQRQIANAALLLITKDAKGQAKVAWRGRLKKESTVVEDTAKAFIASDEQRVDIASRVYGHAFTLLTSRLLQDMK